MIFEFKCAVNNNQYLEIFYRNAKSVGLSMGYSDDLGFSPDDREKGLIMIIMIDGITHGRIIESAMIPKVELINIFNITKMAVRERQNLNFIKGYVWASGV